MQLGIRIQTTRATLFEDVTLEVVEFGKDGKSGVNMWNEHEQLKLVCTTRTQNTIFLDSLYSKHNDIALKLTHTI